MNKIKLAIKNIHEVYYGDQDPFKDPALFMKFHENLQVLFNFAEIESTLVENNPDDVSPQQFKTAFGII